MSIPNTEHWSELNKSILDQWIKLSQLSIENVERLANVNISAAKETLEEQVKNIQALPQIKDTQAWSSWRQKTADAQLESLFGYTRKISEAAAATQGEITKLVEEGIQQYQKNITAWADNASKSAPAGSELAVNAFKNGVAATHAAIDGISKATRQAAEIADAGVKAAVNATISTVKQAQQQTTQATNAAAHAAQQATQQQHNKKAAN
jgi:phasin family protein